MAIVTMKKLKLLAMRSQRDSLLRQLMRLGCVAFSESVPDAETSLPQEATHLHAYRSDAANIQNALTVLQRHSPEKRTGLFVEPPQLSAEQIWDESDLPANLSTAAEVLTLDSALQQSASELEALCRRREALLPWQSASIPLDLKQTQDTCLFFGRIPASVSMAALKDALSSTDTQLLQESELVPYCYLILICHRAEETQIREILHAFSFDPLTEDCPGKTAAEKIRFLSGLIATLEQQQTELRVRLAHKAAFRADLKRSYDLLCMKSAQAEATERLLHSERTIFLHGWIPAEKIKQAERIFTSHGCAWECSEPEEAEYSDVPVALKNNWFTRPLNMVTGMYSLPRYGSLDPNPLIAPFFILFYGIMIADMGYGLIMILGGFLLLRKFHVQGGTRNFAGLLVLCGGSSFLFGAITGAFLGDFIPQLAKMLNPNTTLTALPSLFTPLNDTIAVLIGSLALGLVQILTGMMISVIQKLRAGEWKSALFDEISWWTILTGAALSVFGAGSWRGIPALPVLGTLMLALGGTRNASGFGKLTAFIGLIYNGVSGFFSDILSYARIMALMLAGSVIAQVFNTLGSVSGNLFLFLLIALLGNALNLTLNLLGCYVHDLRLQCLEFFNRFFVEGGKPYVPLAIQASYHQIAEEDF